MKKYKRLFIVLVALLVMPILMASSCDDSGDVGSEPTAVPVEAVDLVDGLTAVGDAIEEAETNDPGAINCISAGNCLREGMNCSLSLFAACKAAGRVDGEPLDCYK